MEDPAAMPVRQVGVVVTGAPADDSIRPRHALGTVCSPFGGPVDGVPARRGAIPSRCIPPCTAG
jgi:hypothetical protein